MFRSICATALLLMGIFMAQDSLAQEAVGEISKISGSAKVARGSKILDAATAMDVLVSDRIQTSVKAQVSVTFKDGSQIEIGESSSLIIERYALSGEARQSALLSLLVGRLRSIVKVLVGPVPVFEVHTPNATASVRGTEFETAYIADRPCPEDRSCTRYTTVGVTRGIVAVRNPSNPTPAVEVHEGYETTVPCESAPSSPAPLGMQDMTAPGYH